MIKPRKTSRQLERHLKGVANHRRLDILFLVAEKDGLAPQDIAELLHGNFKTIAEHARRLAQAGLINKRYKGRLVVHSLSPYGKIIHRFLKTF